MNQVFLDTAVDDLGSAKPSLEENTLFSWLYSATSNQESKVRMLK